MIHRKQIEEVIDFYKNEQVKLANEGTSDVRINAVLYNIYAAFIVKLQKLLDKEQVGGVP